MHLLFLLSLLSFNTLAQTLEAVQSEYAFKDAPEYQAIMSTLKPYGEFSDKTKPEDVIPVKKEMSQGERMVEEAKARNRAILKARDEADKKATQNTEGLTELEKWKIEEKETLAAWKKDTQDKLRGWQREQAIFLGRLKEYKENTFVLPVKKEVIIEKKIPTENLPDAYIVNGAFKVPVRDQWNRPTCTAFAGIRALEILLAQNQVEADLSEQYLYWASKPKCYETPCKEKGSWITPAYRHSQQKMTVDIPLESSCSYKSESLPDNETQLPLDANCQSGHTKVVSYEELKTLADTVQKLKQNTPVVMAAKLSENFYKNQGLVTLSDAQKNLGAKLDSHALGHAFVAVGVIELPKKLQASEGNFCLVIANSWGKGWGAGGYSCLTENWLLKYRQPSAFVAVTKVLLKK